MNRRYQRAYVEITNVCNLRCGFCAPPVKPAAFMEPNLAEFVGIGARFLEDGSFKIHVRAVHEDLAVFQPPGVGIEIEFRFFGLEIVALESRLDIPAQK